MEKPLECQSESDFEAGKNTVMLSPDKLKSQEINTMNNIDEGFDKCK